MFTGIIECVGKILSARENGSNRSFWVASDISGQLKVDQSVSHQGVCLTVEDLDDGRHQVTAIAETLEKTNLGAWKEGMLVNLERCMLMNGRLDGHIVQGHADTTAVCTSKTELDGSWLFTFTYPEKFAPLVIEKGSIAVNGTSLTCFNITHNQFTVAIIPYTYEHTSIHHVREGTSVNVEFDVIGKYVQRNVSYGRELA